MNYDEYLITIYNQGMRMHPDTRPVIVWGHVTEPVYINVTVAEGTPPDAAYKEIMNNIGYELMKLLKGSLYEKR